MGLEEMGGSTIWPLGRYCLDLTFRQSACIWDHLGIVKGLVQSSLALSHSSIIRCFDHARHLPDLVLDDGHATRNT